ncbi:MULTISPECIES: membrane protein insertion efficiency factor YidD [unclassified Neochlamydia]|uniref:membrane protein insertion efficiency factor YidD n=1 Tax=unclassified Neochlamydia TaxID=2643326 RepID=UPI001F611685|nr:MULTISPECIES: membrane protein insertion efficiency factor YidD [unclassified Neochlamydia]
MARTKPAPLQEQPYYCTTPLMGSLAESLIGFHQTIITPIDGPRSNYLPSSSQYTLDAMRKYGFFVGFSMGCDRLMRENDDPWIYPKVTDRQGYLLKYNPVP